MSKTFVSSISALIVLLLFFFFFYCIECVDALSVSVKYHPSFFFIITTEKLIKTCTILVKKISRSLLKLKKRGQNSIIKKGVK